MADWPDTDELKKVLDVDPDGDTNWTLTLDRITAAAIARVKLDVGAWDDAVDEPDDNLSQAALRMAELMALRPDVAAGLGGSTGGSAAGVTSDPVYRSLLFGHRRRFGFS